MPRNGRQLHKMCDSDDAHIRDYLHDLSMQQSPLAHVQSERGSDRGVLEASRVRRGELGAGDTAGSELCRLT